MTRFAPLLFGIQILLAGSAFGADGPPQLDVQGSCNAVASRGTSGRTSDACMNEENTARNTLRDKWAQFTSSQRSRCTGLVRTGGPPSYVELLTCLEMAEQAQKIPDRGLLRGTGGTGLKEGAE
jgi:hypothetical protein